LVFVANITNEFLLGLDLLRTYDACVDQGRKTLCLAEEEVSLWNPGARPQPSSLVVASDLVMHTQYEGVVLALLKSSLQVKNGLVEPRPETHPPEGLYIAKTLVQDCREIPMRVLNATRRDQKLTKDSPGTL
jgi:hypothetical protein